MPVIVTPSLKEPETFVSMVEKTGGKVFVQCSFAPTDSLSGQVLRAFHRMIPPVAPSLTCPSP